MIEAGADPRTWPAALVAERNLALAYALGWRTDPAALAAFRSWSRQSVVRHGD